MKDFVSSCGRARLLIGDCRETLKTLPDASVNCCVTSPPYYGLRDYGVDGQIGLEQTPEAYVAEMVAVFREVRRVLSDDGTLWLNLGDSYAGSWGNMGGQIRGNGTQREINSGSVVKDQAERNGTFTPPGARGFKDSGIKPKDLIGIPWRVAFGLQADGWYLRQDIIWAKPNPMPESVTDRCTKAHEYIFLLSKSAKYFYDGDAIKEPSAYPNGANSPQSIKSPYGQGFTRNAPASHKGSRFDTGKTAKHQLDRAQDGPRIHGNKPGCSDGGSACNAPGQEMRNKRSVWTVATTPFSGAHFATFPPKLIEPCIMAGCPKGGTVLDPFNGAGTTGLVALQQNRNYIGCELNPEYAALSIERWKPETAQTLLDI